MPNEPSDRPPVPLPIHNVYVAGVAIACLNAALEGAIEMAVFPERIKIDNKGDRLKAITEDLIRKAKSIPIEYVPEETEVAGAKVALIVIDEITRRIREKM
jgi:hypothetical protein